MNNSTATTEFTPTVWESYNQVKPLVSGKGIALATITDQNLRTIRFLNLDMRNLMSVKYESPAKGTAEYYVNRSIGKSVGMICERREVLAKLYLDTLPGK